MSGTLGGALERRLLSIVGGTIRVGRLTVSLPDGTDREFRGRFDGPEAHVDLHDWRLLRRLTSTGAIGLADGYVAGEYDSPDLSAFLELAAWHLEPAYRYEVPGWLHAVGRTAWKLLGASAKPRGPLQDIVQHYDLGNDFYEAWLDVTMTYSSAVFADERMTLAEAQAEKYRRLAAATGIGPGDHVLEIGSGWGGFAAMLADEIGCHVTTITVSKQQHDHVEKLIADRGLADRVQAQLRDFRDVRGDYDHIVSVEMMESIPASLWSPFFGQLRSLTKPGGTIGLQLIEVAEHHWSISDTNLDFVRRYIFPGGQVPSEPVLRDLASAFGLRWRANREYGQDYARTLRAWLAGFDAAWPSIRGMSAGFDDRFRRMWRYYLAYCGAGFAVGRVDVSQIVLERP
jgi:cyclopropane-fatty-acyl-phospholipid synthase